MEGQVEKPLPQDVARKAADAIGRIIDNVDTVIVGKRETVRMLVCTLMARGHALVEDMPGTGKTTMVRALATSVECDFKRVQFTPDTMPTDLIGFSFYNEKVRDFEYQAGSLMTNIMLADEINRAPAKVQSALLEAMEERQVTVDGETHYLSEPFMVMATQNPIEQYGTYPLAEAQLDRFLVKLSMGYPTLQEEVDITKYARAAKAKLQPVISAKDVVALQRIVDQVFVSDPVLTYTAQVVMTTRDRKDELSHGASPRATLALTDLARAWALSEGRGYVLPEDIKLLAPFVLCHRIQLTHEAKVNGRTTQEVVDSILHSVATPVYEEAEAAKLDVESAQEQEPEQARPSSARQNVKVAE
ncbi:MAG: AAA family ATPase [Coriobacteriales bacterium]|jgi:MoxR-like ATPase